MDEDQDAMFEEHNAVFSSLPGAAEVIAWYAGVPEFHDAAFSGLTLNPGRRSSVTVEFWRLQPRSSNTRVLVPVDRRYVVFTFAEVVDLMLESFGPRTELNSLWLRRALVREGRPRFSLAQPEDSDLELELDPHYGLMGWLRCKDMRVHLESVVDG